MFYSLPIHRQLLFSVLFIIAYLCLFACLVFLLNRGAPNAIFSPLSQYLSMFSVVWDENPWAALQLIISKSFLALSHQDPRSGLKLWTVELDSISFMVYLITAWILFGTLLSAWAKSNSFSAMKKTVFPSVAGGLLLFASVSYMSVIDHCAGPTWIGFVSAYGLGASKFEHYPIYQIITALSGSALIALSVYQDPTLLRSWNPFRNWNKSLTPIHGAT